MNIKNSLFIFSLFIVLICSVTVINAVSTDSMDNIASDMISNGEFISVSSDELASCVDESKSVLQAKEGNLITNDILKDEDDGFEDDDWDGDDYEDFEDDDWDDEEYELDDEEINEYLEDIKSSTSNEYYNFVKYLLDTKKLSFNENSIVDGGYKLFATEKYEMKLYDGSTYNTDYFISTYSGLDLYVEGFYPNTFHYNEYGNVVFDKLYYTWQDSQTLKYIDYNYTKEASTLPIKYDLRDYNHVTSVKNQKEEGNCWAFASIAALESYLLKSEGKTYDFSENNLKNVMSSIGSIGTDKVVNAGGNMYMSVPYFIRWSGPILEKDDEYLSNNIIENLKPVKHVQGIKYILNRTEYLDNNEIKNAIMNYGAVVTTIWWEDAFVRDDTNSFYYPLGKSSNHAICIVGWDDNYPKSNFKVQTENMGDGAFIIKNSWGDGVGEGGYYYVSYYDPTLAIKKDSSLVSYVFTDVEDDTNYGFNYHYTPLGFNNLEKIDGKDVSFYNQWISHKDDTLEACGFYNFIPSICQIKVSVDDKLQRTIVEALYDTGFYTIKFEPIDILKGQKFKIEITLTSQYDFNYVALEKKFEGYSKVNANPDESFVYIGGEWKDMSKNNSSNVCLNAYTKYFDLKETKIIANNMVMNYGENKFLDITLMDIDNNPIKNAEIILSINNNENKLNTDNNGKASLSLKDISASELDINIKYWGDKTYDYSQKKVTVTINKLPTTITVQSFTYNDNYLKIDLKNGKKSISNKMIVISINGKTYNAKTNTNGRATLKAPKSVFTGGSKITVQFKGDTNYKYASNSKNVGQLVVKINGVKSKYKTSEKVAIKLDKKISLKLKVTVKIKGKTYTAYFKTNKNGKANINLYSKFKKHGLTKSEYTFSFLRTKTNNVNVVKLSKNVKIY